MNDESELHKASFRSIGDEDAVDGVNPDEILLEYLKL